MYNSDIKDKEVKISGIFDINELLVKDLKSFFNSDKYVIKFRKGENIIGVLNKNDNSLIIINPFMILVYFQKIEDIYFLKMFIKLLKDNNSILSEYEINLNFIISSKSVESINFFKRITKDLSCTSYGTFDSIFETKGSCNYNYSNKIKGYDFNFKTEILNSSNLLPAIKLKFNFIQKHKIGFEFSDKEIDFLYKDVCKKIINVLFTK